MRRIVTIMGTDGSGKTTLTSELVNALRKDGVDAVGQWLGAENYILATVRKIMGLRLPWRRAATNDSAALSPSYILEAERGRLMVNRHRWTKRLYIFTVLLDYRVQLALKLLRTRHREILVADRYLFDVVVNLGLTTGLSPKQTVALAQRQAARVPTAQVRIFLRVEPEISMQRKDDIPDIDFVRLRFRYYEAVAAAFGFVVLDGTRPIKENCAWLRDYVLTSLARPAQQYRTR